MPVVIPAAIAAVGAVANFVGHLFSSADKRDAMYAGANIADQQANNQAVVNAEQLRRMQLQDSQVLAQNTGEAYSSGFAMSVKGQGAEGQFVPNSTTEQYLGQMQKEQATEEAFAKSQGDITVGLMHEKASAQRSAADAGMWGDVFGSVGQLSTDVYSMGKSLNWFGGGSGGGG